MNRRHRTLTTQLDSEKTPSRKGTCRALLLITFFWLHEAFSEFPLPTVDHIIPVSKGGSNTARNVQLLCESYNWKKHDKIIELAGGNEK